MDAFVDYYRLLRVGPDASLEDIKKAYRERMRFFHPDGHRDDPGRRAIAEAESKEINEAYKTLSEIGRASCRERV